MWGVVIALALLCASWLLSVVAAVAPAVAGAVVVIALIAGAVFGIAKVSSRKLS